MSEHGSTGVDVIPQDDGLEQSRRFAAVLGRLEGYRRHRPGYADLGAADMRLLWLLVDSGPLTLSEVTEALGLERSTVSRQVNAAADGDLVAKTRVPGSSAYRVEVTDSGRAAFERAAQRALEVIGQVLDDLGRDEAEQLIELIDRFAEAYGERVTGDGF